MSEVSGSGSAERVRWSGVVTMFVIMMGTTGNVNRQRDAARVIPSPP
jgi:hypothetical protein